MSKNATAKFAYRCFLRIRIFRNRFKQVVFKLPSYLVIKIIKNDFLSAVCFNPSSIWITWRSCCSGIFSENFRKLSGKNSMMEFMFSNTAVLSTVKDILMTIF